MSNPNTNALTAAIANLAKISGETTTEVKAIVDLITETIKATKKPFIRFNFIEGDYRVSVFLNIETGFNVRFKYKISSNPKIGLLEVIYGKSLTSDFLQTKGKASLKLLKKYANMCNDTIWSFDTETKYNENTFIPKNEDHYSVAVMAEPPVE